MSLPPEFRFSQGSLQDYVECARRFQLRYVRRLRWPAVEVSPALENERHLQQGAAFHRLVHQHLMGLPRERLSRTIADPKLRHWWGNYLEGGPQGLPSQRHPEMELSAPVAGFHLVAQYDLVAVQAGVRAVIVDWKTNRRRPDRGRLLNRLQTRVYPYILVQAGGVVYGGETIPPEQVSMIYWFAEFPGDPETYAYGEGRHRADHRFLTALVTEIGRRLTESGEGLLPRADDRRACRYCGYRSLCRRGVEAGLLDEPGQPFLAERAADPGFGFEFDFEQIAEADHG